MVRQVLTVVGLCGLLAAALPASQDLTKPEADSMGRKVNAILERGARPPGKNVKPLRTSFSEREANAYFKYYGPEFMPVGVINPRVVIDQGGRVKANAVVDLDAGGFGRAHFSPSSPSSSASPSPKSTPDQSSSGSGTSM